MKTSKNLFVLLMALSLFSLPALASDNDYSRYGTGLSLSFGNHHNSLQIQYSRNHQGYLPYRDSHYINHHYTSKPFATHRPSAVHKHKQLMYRLGSRRHALGSRNKHHDRYGVIHNKHYPYKSYYSRPYSRYSRDHYSDRNYGYGHPPKACHPITKVISDRYGRYQSINNTVCYDKYGQSYIVPRRGRY